jgi:hypothetical protein
MQRIVIIACACLVLVASGVVHGVWTDRWAEATDLVDAANRLEQLPLKIGAWHGSVVEMDKDARTGLAGVIARRYVHATTGKVVTILLGCGRAGPVCTHTPEVCYAGSGYEVEKPKLFSLPASGTPAAEFWTARFVKERQTSKTHLRIFWAWHGADAWRVADNPRLAFAGEKVLYKLYVIREMVQSDEPLETDACVEFMQELLPAVRQTVFPSHLTPVERAKR